MTFWTVFFAGYLITTVIAVTLTYAEQKRRGIVTPGFVLIGYLLCLIWPLVAAVMVLIHRLTARRVPD